MRILFALPLLVFLFSCSKKRVVPTGILEPKKMELVFWDYIRAEVYTRDFIKKDGINDTLQNVMLQKKIFAYYNISKEEFYKSYDYYTRHPELMTVLTDSILARQNRVKLEKQLKITKPRNSATNQEKAE